MQLWPNSIRLEMVEKSQSYPSPKVYQYGYFDGFQKAINTNLAELPKTEFTYQVVLSKNEAKHFISKLETRISLNSIYPTLRKENEFLYEILDDAKKLFGMDVVTEIDKLKDKLDGKV